MGDKKLVMRTFDNRMGFYLINLFQPLNQNYRIYVNRGWIPKSQRNDDFEDKSLQKIQGLLKHNEHHEVSKKNRDFFKESSFEHFIDLTKFSGN